MTYSAIYQVFGARNFSVWLALAGVCGVLSLMACKEADYVNVGGNTGNKATPPVTQTVVSSTTVTSPGNATTATSGITPDSVIATGLLRQMILSGPAGSLTTTFGYTSASPALLTSYTTTSGTPSSQTTVIVTLSRTGSMVTEQRENTLSGNSLTSVKRSFIYDGQGQLLTVEQEGISLDRYTYDATGALVNWQRLAGSGDKSQEVYRASLIWRSGNIRFVKEENVTTGTVEEITWQANNYTNYRRRFYQQQGLPLVYSNGFGSADLLNPNSPIEASEQFSGRRLRYTHTIGANDRLTERIITEWAQGQWAKLATEKYMYW